MEYPYTYLTAWVLACCVAWVLFLAERDSYELTNRDYWRFLFQPWKTTTFLFAAGILVLIAPCSGDPTWDLYDAGFMSLLTYLTAPWVVGVLYKIFMNKAPVRRGFVACCLWMFSASWSYDLYILCRDGYYPSTWFQNLMLSSILYVSAGLLWNLDWVEGKGGVLAFRDEDWPSPPNAKTSWRILWFALPFMGIAAALTIPFIWSCVFS